MTYSSKEQRAKSLAERFWEKVQVGESDQCWPWATAIRSGLHGNFHVVRGRSTSAHRVAWQLTRGDIPSGMFVCHACDYPPCCNPAHLFLGTPKDNMRDKIAKGRNRVLSGTDLPQTKIPPDERAAIRATHDGTPADYTRLAEQYGVSPATIYRIMKESPHEP